MKKILIWCLFKFWFLPWSKNIRHIERSSEEYIKYMLEAKMKVTRFNRSIPFNSPISCFENFWKDESFKNFFWKGDGIDVAFDAMSDPYEALRRGYGDCDDYASISRELLGKKFVDRGSMFEFKFFLCCIYQFSFFDLLKKFFKMKKQVSTAHIVSIWTTENNDEIFLTSNNQCLLLKNSSSKETIEELERVLNSLTESKIEYYTYFDDELEKVRTTKNLNMEELK